MSGCYTTQRGKKHACPSCKQACLPVTKRTVLHHLQRPYHQTAWGDDFYHCVNVKCSLRYFSASMMIADDQIRQQPSPSTAMLCYCFDVSQDVYHDALVADDSAVIKNFILQQTHEGLCACDVRNPSGRCCLAAFKQMENQYDY
ncbi:MAG: hypothetical protein R8L53_09995 [Mariprofundales bacterium]